MELDAGTIKLLLPKVPMLGKTAVLHSLGMSPTSKMWDLKTELTVNVVRSFIQGRQQPVSKAQHVSLKAPPIKGKMWISKVVLSASKEDSCRQALFQAIEEMKDVGTAKGGFEEPDLLPVEAEWTGYRAGATKQSPELSISEEQKYKELMKEATAPTTILYFHGGAHYLMDPATHRTYTAKLAGLTKGRCLSVRYRLSPQHPFPAAILDALVAYLTLLYPISGSWHTAVDPAHIVFAGDSAGGNVCAGLLQLLLQFQRTGKTILWDGVERTVPIPAAVAMSSPWLDITSSSPSCINNGKYDYLPSRADLKYEKGVEYPPCDIWPAKPPRRSIYVVDSLLGHPLASPLAAGPSRWEGCCPLWFSLGWELLSDEGKHLATIVAKQGVPVVYDEYQAMPHCFQMVVPGHAVVSRCFKSWADFITMAVENKTELKTKGTLIRAKTLKEEELDVLNMSQYTEEEVQERIKTRVMELRMNVTEPAPMAML